MQSPRLVEIKTLLDQTDWSGRPVLRLAVLRNVTVEPGEPFWRYEALRMDHRAELAFGAFDHIIQEATQPGGPVTLETDVVLVFVHLPTLSPRLAADFHGLSAAERDTEIEHIQAFIRSTLEGLRAKTPAMILWHSFETPIDPAGGILDDQTDGSQTARVEQLNAFLRSELNRRGGAYLVNLDRCRARVGAGSFYDRRLWHVARAPWSLAALQEIAREDFKFIRALKGKSAKCLVLDCDNTLWGGIIGEDGLAGIQLGSTFPGSAYVEFQREILNLQRRGILIALCSRNNEADVWEVFDRHPDMVLKREHLAAWRLNWTDKVSNLQQLAAELNIGLDSLVFADDNDFEINLVRQALPAVHVLPLPRDRAQDYAGILASCGLFDTLELSAEDLARTAMIRAETQRQALRTSAASLSDYLRSLEMTLTIAPADEFSIPRIAQLTQKTNQFNLTTRRYTEEHIRAFVRSPDSEVYTLRVSDRLGDSGLVGVCILKYEGQEVILDSFLLSCRILGRTVEDVFLNECLRRARRRGARRVIGHYRPTPKNSQTADFYPRCGFTALASEAADGEQAFAFDLTQDLPPTPAYFTLAPVPAGGPPPP